MEEQRNQFTQLQLQLQQHQKIISELSEERKTLLSQYIEEKERWVEYERNSLLNDNNNNKKSNDNSDYDNNNVKNDTITTPAVGYNTTSTSTIPTETRDNSSITSLTIEELKNHEQQYSLFQATIENQLEEIDRAKHELSAISLELSEERESHLRASKLAQWANGRVQELEEEVNQLKKGYNRVKVRYNCKPILLDSCTVNIP